MRRGNGCHTLACALCSYRPHVSQQRLTFPQRQDEHFLHNTKGTQSEILQSLVNVVASMLLTPCTLPSMSGLCTQVTCCPPCVLRLTTVCTAARCGDIATDSWIEIGASRTRSSPRRRVVTDRQLMVGIPDVPSRPRIPQSRLCVFLQTQGW